MTFGAIPGIQDRAPGARSRPGDTLARALVYGIRAYAVHFESQMHRGIVRRILSNSYLYFARAGAILLGLDPAEIM